MTTPQRVGHAAPGALRVLLAGAIDYAGLFPPAQLDMPGAVSEYASYLASSDAWALGWFVVPAVRLEEMATAAASLASTRAFGASMHAVAAWRLSALSGGDIGADMARVHGFNELFARDTAGPWAAKVEAVELRAASTAAIEDAVGAVGDAFECYVEIPIGEDPQRLIETIGRAHARAKVRTGGTTSDAFPTTDDLLRFLTACVGARVPFKATAGLHHPLCGTYALTYAADSARWTMFGFLNVFLATAFLRAGADEGVARSMLEETDSESIRFDGSGIVWRDHRLARADLEAARSLSITAFGSCSFREPLDDLATIGMA